MPPDFEALREQMVREQIEARGIDDPRVIAAMRRIPRHLFVPEASRHLAYNDTPLPIDANQTISQPYIVAFMLQALELRGKEIVLEIGTGSGYQTALLCQLAREVISIEYQAALVSYAARVLSELHIRNVRLYEGDGSQGMADQAPFEAIIVSAAAPFIPPPLVAQLDEGGRLVLPVAQQRRDDRAQVLVRVRRQGKKPSVERLLSVMFVPLLGRYGFKPADQS